MLGSGLQKASLFLAICTLISFATTARSQDERTDAIRAKAHQSTLGAEICPADGASIALLTRQAFDEGRVPEGLAYGRFLDQLRSAERVGVSDEDIVENSLAIARKFVEQMNARGHDFGVGDLIVHRESELETYLKLFARKPISKARYELELATIREMKKRICR